MAQVVFKPTRDQLIAAQDRTIRDVIAPDLRVLFCGINPGLYSGATGNHFARPGTRFWPALHAGGFTPRILHPSEKKDLLTYGLGITNIVARTTAAEAELSREEIVAGGVVLRRKLKKYRPKFLAVLGIGAYRHAFVQPEAKLGLQPELIGDTRLWVLPNPSGLNAHYGPPALAALFRELNEASLK
jgi:TDG/mug DNA glycosylase family protein